jgi:hypothetical protein
VVGKIYPKALPLPGGGADWMGIQDCRRGIKKESVDNHSWRSQVPLFEGKQKIKSLSSLKENSWRKRTKESCLYESGRTPRMHETIRQGIKVPGT